MGGLRTWAALPVVCALAQTPPVWAETPDPFRLFATCTGRLSAQMEHQWLTSDPAADQTQARREAMAALLLSVTPPGQESAAMALRIEAKVAQAGLLTRAWQGRDAWAARRAERLVADCAALMLG